MWNLVNTGALVSNFNVDIHQNSAETSLYAEISPLGSNGAHQIELYYINIRADLDSIDGMNPDVAAAALAGIVTHELYHKCLGLIPDPPAPGSCAHTTDSCEHLAIDVAVAADMCGLAKEMKEGYMTAASTDPFSVEAMEALAYWTGACIAHNLAADKWNNNAEGDSEPTQVANECLCPSAFPMGNGAFCPFTPDPENCPSAKLPDPTNPSYDPASACSDPDNLPFTEGADIIPACPEC